MTATILRERLSSALAAIALQVGMLALLALSFEVVRHFDEGKETILTLPPLAQPAPAAKAVVIDGRQKPAPDTAPAPPQALPAWMTPGFALGGGQNGILLAPLTGTLGCAPGADPTHNVSVTRNCPPPAFAQRDPNAPLLLLPDKLIPNAPTFQAGIDRRNAPAALPGAPGGWVSMLFTLLVDPGAFGDRSRYTYAQPPAPTLDSTEMTFQFVQHMADCPRTVMDDTSYRNCQADSAAAPLFKLIAGGADGSGPHATDAAFQEARAAAQARRSLYARPVLASGAQSGGGNEKDGGSGGAGNGAVAGGTSTDASLGR